MKATVYAYKDENINVLLCEHNKNVGEAIGSLFKEFLKVSTPTIMKVNEFTGIKDSVWTASVIAGTLHDLGKASKYYQVVKDGRTFNMHEFISSIILVEVAEKALEEGLDEISCVFNLIAWAISRHHSAMECRHPSDLRRYLRKEIKGYLNNKCETFYRFLRNALVELEEVFIIEGIPKELRRPKLLNRILNAVNYIKDKNPNDVIIADIEALVEYVDHNPKFCNLDREMWMALVEVVSGALIVSDILVAGRERRSSDDSFSTIYARYWEKELRMEGKDLILNENNVDEAVNRLLAEL